MTTEPRITVIVPTRARPDRADLLRRAIDSILEQGGVEATPLVVLNGPEQDPAIEEALRADSRIRILRMENADLPGAYRRGLEEVDTPWVTALDDDDLLLPGALSLRVRRLEERPECASVVTNGIRRGPEGDMLHVPAGVDVEADPFGTLLDLNWLLPGSWLCTKEVAGDDLFDAMPRYLECTFLALRLATRGRLLWLDEPTVVYNEGSPGAESETAEYLLGHPEALRRTLELDLPEGIRERLEVRVGAACHTASEVAREQGKIGEAWRWHLASLRERRGWRYLPYTRHLLLASLGFRR